MLMLKSLKVLMCWYSEGSAHDSSDALHRLFSWYRQQRPSGRTTSAPAEPSTVCLPNTTLRHYHDTNLLLYFALFVGRYMNVGNRQNLVLYQKRGNGFVETEVARTELWILCSKVVIMSNVRIVGQDWTLQTSIYCCAFQIQHYWHNFITKEYHVISCWMISEGVI